MTKLKLDAKIRDYKYNLSLKIKEKDYENPKYTNI